MDILSIAQNHNLIGSLFITLAVAEDVGNAAGKDPRAFSELVVGKFSTDCLSLVITACGEVPHFYVVFLSWTASDLSTYFDFVLLHR